MTAVMLAVAMVSWQGASKNVMANSQAGPNSSCNVSHTAAVAVRLTSPLDAAGFPTKEAWRKALPLSFCADWQGLNPDPQRETDVRLIWSPETLFLSFRARYRELYVFPDSVGQRNMLWDRDVAEMFIQPPIPGSFPYKEFEVAPNGDWIDLDITAPRKGRVLDCDIRTRASIDSTASVWTAEMAIPVKCLSSSIDSAQSWRVNFFRCEGRDPERYYSSWRATNTPKPDFHVPEAFGELRFAKE